VRLGLVPKSGEFYDFFVEAGANALEAARLVERRFREHPNSSVLQSHVKDVEHEGDRITRDIIQLLNTQYITPFDREDIYELATTLDDIVDLIEEVADFLALYRIEAPMEQAQELSSILHHACREVAAAIPLLRSFGDIRRHTVEVNRLENEGDRKVREALASLFETGIDPMMVIRWKDIFERLEEAIDATEHVANILEGIAIKNS
jgi:uncharacterized protein